MYRIASVLKTAGLTVCAVTVLMFVPPARNILTLGLLPGLWRDASTFQLIKAQVYSYSADSAALAPCTEPARARTRARATLPSSPGHGGRLQQLLQSEPYTEARANPKVVQAQAKARAWVNATAERRELYRRFLPQMSPVDKARMLVMWRVLHEALTLNNISHFLCDGSLLGAFRHGGLIPWDDDFDLAVDGSDAEKVQRVLSCIPGYTLRVQPSMHWKFFWSQAPMVEVVSTARVLQPRVLKESEKESHVTEYHPLDAVAMRFPFLDIFLVTSDGSYLWTLANFNVKTTLFPVEDVYPLATVSYEGRPAPVPRNSVRLLRRIYQPNMCASNGHNHQKGHGISDIDVVPCAELGEMYTVYHV